MAYPPYLREKARRLRIEKRLTIDELADCLALSRTTIYSWVRDLPIERSGRQNRGQRLGNAAMQSKYRALREEAYDRGRRTFPAFAEDPLFRDFVTLYIAEGYKRDRNKVVLGNSDPALVAFIDAWLGGSRRARAATACSTTRTRIRRPCARSGDTSSGWMGQRSAPNASRTADSSPPGGGGRSTACWACECATPFSARGCRHGWIACEGSG